MKNLIHEIRWKILQYKRNKLLPDAFFDERKRIELCRIDEKLIKIKRKKDINGSREKIFLAQIEKRFF